MEALTPAAADDLPPLGELVADDLFWRYPAGGLAREGAARLRVWLTSGREAGYLAVVTETGTAASVTESAGRIRALLARMYGPSVVLLEHYPAPEFGEGAETLDLVRVGADGNPHWTRVWPTPEDNPRHAGLDRWLCVTHSQWNACQNLLNICAQKECQAILAWLLIYVEVREHILGPVRQRSIRFAK